jgi:hypothetical protein
MKCQVDEMSQQIKKHLTTLESGCQNADIMEGDQL